MRQRMMMAVALVAGILMVVSTGQAEKKQKEVNLKGIKCLICNMQVSKDITADYKGGKIYFGCPACPDRFKADTAKYAAKANAQLAATKQVRQKRCPMSGKPCNKDFVVKVAGVDVAFCCGRCKNAVAKLKGDAQVAKVFNDKAFKKAFEIPKKK